MAKVRVYELAKELGVESKTVLSMLKDMGEFVRSASSTVEAPVERRLKEKLASEPPPVKKAPAKKAAAKKADGEQAPSAPAAADVPVEVPATRPPRHRTHRGSAPGTSRACHARSASGICPSGATGCADAAPAAQTRPRHGPAANGSSASWRAPSSGPSCAGCSDRRATDCRAAATSRVHWRTSWRSGRTASRHPTARKQPVRILARNGPARVRRVPSQTAPDLLVRARLRAALHSRAVARAFRACRGRTRR